MATAAWRSAPGDMERLGRGWIGRYAAALWAIGLGMPLMASAGWMIEQIEYANLGAEGTRTLQYISKNRTVGDGNTFIMDFAKNLFIATDQENRVYWSGTVDAYVQEVKTFQQAANDWREQMEEAMKEMPPDQRKSVEDLLQQMRSANASSTSSPAAKRPAVKVEPTSRTASIAGQPPPKSWSMLMASPTKKCGWPRT